MEADRLNMEADRLDKSLHFYYIYVLYVMMGEGICANEAQNLALTYLYRGGISWYSFLFNVNNYCVIEIHGH